MDEWYDNVLCQSDPDGAGATHLTLTSDAIGIDFVLAQGLTISGTVTDEATAQGIENVEIAAIDAVGDYLEYTRSDANGAYTITGLASGDCRVRAWIGQGYLAEWYDNVIYLSDPGGAGATHLTLTSDATGIDFQFSKAD